MAITCPFCDNTCEAQLDTCPGCSAHFHHLTDGQTIATGKRDRRIAHAFFLAAGRYTVPDVLRVVGKLALVGVGPEPARVEGGDEYYLVNVRGMNGSPARFVARGVVLVASQDGSNAVSVEEGSALLVDFAIESSVSDRSNTAYGLEVGECGEAELRDGSIIGIKSEGVRLTKDARLVASKVRVARCGWTGITAVDRATVELDACKIEDNHSSGIYVRDEVSMVARACHIMRNGHEGVEVSNGHAQVLNCELAGNKGDPITFSGQATGDVRDNQCTGNGGFGTIVLFGASSPLIGKNKVDGKTGDCVRDMRDDDAKTALVGEEVRVGSSGLGGFLKRLFGRR